MPNYLEDEISLRSNQNKDFDYTKYYSAVTFIFQVLKINLKKLLFNRIRPELNKMKEEIRCRLIREYVVEFGQQGRHHR